MFKKKKDKPSEIFSGIHSLNKTLNVNELIIKIGGLSNVISAVQDDDQLVINLKDIKQIKFKYFKAHKTIRNFFVNHKEHKISLTLDEQIVIKAAERINLLIN